MNASEELFSKVMALAKRRGFLWPSCEIYGGAGGLYDYGPLGSALKASVEGIWRRYYVTEEGFAELSAPALAPEAVFKASGHLDKFSDVMVECGRCGEAFRADHLIKEKAGEETPSAPDELVRLLKGLRLACPECGGPLSEPFPFNLMFRTSLGPGSKKVGYLRPETAQTMFLDFALLYRFFREKLPFGAVQLGRGYRNEIAPRQGLIRLREFNMAEAEIFVDPEKKGKHPRFGRVAGDILRLLPDGGGEREAALGDAVREGIIANEWVAYYMGLTARFLVEVGVDPAMLRFRQHKRTEMAHYAADCWDAEALLSLGWTELVGIADRTCYDLEAHMRHSGAELRAFAPYPSPRSVVKKAVRPNHAVLGPRYKKDAKAIARALESLDPALAEGKEALELDVEGRAFALARDCFSVSEVTETESGRWFTPHVIEPSYGIDRIIYAMLEHAYAEGAKGPGGEAAKEEGYVVLRLKPSVAPIQVAVFPLVGKEELARIAEELEANLRAAGLRTHFDAADSIGRRYARMDEVGTPFCVTVDFDTLRDASVTVRDRDTTRQVRRAIAGLTEFMRELVSGRAAVGG